MFYIIFPVRTCGKMKSFLVLTVLVTIGHCSEQAKTSSFLYSNFEENWLRKLSSLQNLTYSPDNVMLYFYNKNNPNTSWVSKVDDISDIKNSPFNPSNPVVFLIHGWRDSHTSKMCVILKDALLSAYDVNVFVVDWNSIAKWDYATARVAVKTVGGYVAGFINLLEKNFKINLSNVKLVGHSLGAHVAGNAGDALQGQLGSIMGLDPAGPAFTTKEKADRLDKSDAKFVEAIHTNTAVLGINYEVAHVDYWPNGGKKQPGCSNPICSHERSYYYYAESIKSKKFVARKCADYESYTSGKCNNNTASSMGMYDEDRSASGDYMLTTNSNSPFAKG